MKLLRSWFIRHVRCELPSVCYSYHEQCFKIVLKSLMEMWSISKTNVHTYQGQGRANIPVRLDSIPPCVHLHITSMLFPQLIADTYTKYNIWHLTTCISVLKQWRYDIIRHTHLMFLCILILIHVLRVSVLVFLQNCSHAHDKVPVTRKPAEEEWNRLSRRDLDQWSTFAKPIRARYSWYKYLYMSDYRYSLLFLRRKRTGILDKIGVKA